MSSDSTLFEPITVGDLRLSHRIVMAPLTRFRADAQHVHQPVAAEYYSQRASTPGTLLITEATFIDPKASGYANVPGIWNDEQVQGWKRVVEAVHAKGCKIFLQLWALGRAADADNLREETGEDVQSASDIAFEGGATPRPLTKDEIKVRSSPLSSLTPSSPDSQPLAQDYVSYYARAAKKFVEEAGGDGCEVHNANGTLLSLSQPLCGCSAS